MKYPLTLHVNGDTYEVDVRPQWSLLEVLRDELELTGTNDGCRTGNCGACTVLLDGVAVSPPETRTPSPIPSCLMLALNANGHRIMTIEGLSTPDDVHPLQRAFVERGAIQCGYCTPGMILSAYALLEENPHPSETEVRHSLVGNLCRCTGYAKIVEAVLAAAKGSGGAGEPRSRSPEPKPRAERGGSEGTGAREIKSEIRNPKSEIRNPHSPFSHIGKRIPKPDALPKATGEVVYGHDLKIPRMLHGKILRSPLPHARILHIDTSRARRLPGVKAVITAQDLPAGGVRVSGGDTATRFGFGNDRTPLKGDKVRRFGDEVAAVAAIDVETAEEALELIDVEYEPLPTLFDPEMALQPDAPLIHEDRESNLFRHQEYVHGEPDRALAEADVVVEDEFDLGYVQPAPLETSFCLADFDSSGKLTVWSTTQIPFQLQKELSDALGIPGGDIRIIQPAIGGGFGRGLDMYAFEPICVWLARKAGRPVRLAFTRQEEFVASEARQPMRVKARSGAMQDGRLWVRDVKLLLDNGAYVSWGTVTTLVLMEAVGSLYRVPHARVISDSVYTNNPITGAMRGFGNPQGTFIVEVQMDRLAEAIGMDPLAFRLRNANQPFEETPQGLKITSCGLRECLEEAGQQIGWEQTRGEKGRKGEREKGRRGEGENGKGKMENGEVQSPSSNLQSPISDLQSPISKGIGVAATMNVGGGARIYRSDGCGCIVKVDDFGRVSLLTGATEIGQGSDVALTQIVAEELGISPEGITVVNDDTALTPWDVGVHASRTTFIAGKAALIAAQEVKAQILETAEEMLEVAPADLELRDGHVRVRGAPERRVSFDKVVRARHFRAGGQVIIGHGWYDPPNEMVGADGKGNISAAYGFGAQAIEVEVDMETGHVRPLRVVSAHDVGRAINPMYVEGQIEGGVVMGLGYALSEELQVHEGRVLNLTPFDYRMLTIMDAPPIESVIIETDDPEGPFGAKGVGEMGTNPTAAAVANAVYDAIGVRINSLPITPEKVLRALRNAG